MRNRRLDQRAASRLRIRFWPPTRPTAVGAGFTSNLSPGGAFIETNQPLKSGSRVRIELQTGEGGFLVEAVVVRGVFVAPELQAVKRSGMAIRFLHVADVVQRLHSRPKPMTPEAIHTPKPSSEPESEQEFALLDDAALTDHMSDQVQQDVHASSATDLAELEALEETTLTEDRRRDLALDDTTADDNSGMRSQMGESMPNSDAAAETSTPDAVDRELDELDFESPDSEAESPATKTPDAASAARAPMRTSGALAMGPPTSAADAPELRTLDIAQLPEAAQDLVHRALVANPLQKSDHPAGGPRAVQVNLDDLAQLRQIYDRDLRYGGCYLASEDPLSHDAVVLQLDIGEALEPLRARGTVTQRFRRPGQVGEKPVCIVAILFDAPREVAAAVERLLETGRAWS